MADIKTPDSTSANVPATLTAAVKQLTELKQAQEDAVNANTHTEDNSPHKALAKAWDALTDEDVKVAASSVVHGGKSIEDAAKDLTAAKKAKGSNG